MTALIAVALAGFLYATNDALTRSAEAAARDRLTRAARQVAGTVEQATQARSEQLKTIAKDSALLRAARLKFDTLPPVAAAPARRPAATTAATRRKAGPRPPPKPTPDQLRRAAREVMSVLVTPRSGLTVELWDPVARRNTYTGANLRASGAAVLPPNARFALLEKGGPPADSVRWSPLHGHKGQTYFWGIAPIVDRDSTIGYIALQRRVGGPAQVNTALADMLGQDVTLSLRNRSGSYVSRAPDQILTMPARDSTDDGVFNQWPDLGRTYVGEARVAGTPWVVMLDSPVDVVLAAPRQTIRELALISLGLVLLGALLAWSISRRITRPIAQLTSSAETLAKGERGDAVKIRGRDEVARLTASFERMADEVTNTRNELERRVSEAESGNRAKSDFLAAMSHELRTPLNAIGGYAQLLEMEIHGPLTDEQRDALKRLGRSQAHLMGLINDVLNFARVDAGQVHYRIDDVDTADAVRGAELLVAPQMRAKGMTFDRAGCESNVLVRADAERLQQILLNLLGNAIKFTPSGGRISVSCEARDEMVDIRVADTGRGIPEDKHAAIFEPFVQAERALNRPNEGVGLGLTISRDLARGMGGDITVASAPGEGATFTLTLPRATAGVTAGRLPSAERPVSAEGPGSRS